MKRHAILRVLSAVSCVALVAVLLMPAMSVAKVSAAPASHKVTVFVKNYLEEYNVATAEFLAAQFDDLDSPAYGLVTYSVVTTLTQESLAGSSALIIDLSADMSLTTTEAALIHTFTNLGGRVGLFTYPRYYWDHVGPNPAAFALVADLFGNAVVGEPAASEVTSGNSSAQVTSSSCVSGVCFTSPYTVTEAMVATFDDAPFTPITSAGTTAVMTSTALGGAAVAVANAKGLLVTNALGDLVQGNDSNEAYHQFVVDAIVWLANTGSTLPNKFYLPLVFR